MPTIRDQFLTQRLDLHTLCQVHPFVAAYRPHGSAAYQDLKGSDRMSELHWARDTGRWRHPATNELDKAMDGVRKQHKTTATRSWHCLVTECEEGLTPTP